MTLGQGNVCVRVSVDEARDFPTVYGLSYGQRSSGELVEQHIDGTHMRSVHISSADPDCKQQGGVMTNPLAWAVAAAFVAALVCGTVGMVWLIFAAVGA